MTSCSTTARAWICLVGLAPQLLGCGGSGGGGGHASPESVAAAAKKAIDEKDMGAFYDCLTVESQNVLAGTAVMVGSMMKLMAGMGALGGPEVQAEAQQDAAEMTAILEKHGVTEESLKGASPNPAMMGDPQAISGLADAVQDKRALVHDVFTLLDKLREGDSDMGSQFTGELKDLKIDGDRATAKLMTPRGEEELDFHKTADGWKLHIDMGKIGRGAAAAPPAEPGEGQEAAAEADAAP